MNISIIKKNHILKQIIALALFIITLSVSNTVYARPLSKATAKNPCVISAIGDSITYSTTYAAVLDTLPEIVVKNYGQSATQVAGPFDHSFVNRTHNVKYKSDIILIFGGTNDFKGVDLMCNPLGMPDSTDPLTFFGAYNTMVKNIKKNNPNSKIVLITPIKRAYWDKPNAYGLSLNHYALATQMVAESNGVHCIDLFNNPSCDFTENGMLIDGIHPDIKGHSILAMNIYQQLLDIK